MTRPFKCRKIGFLPRAYYFKPRAVPICALEEIVLRLDEFEALRLADVQNKEQAEAAAAMHVSRQTFGNILASARGKTADVIVNGKALKIEGGCIEIMTRNFICGKCGNKWEPPFGTGRPDRCPKCSSNNIRRSPTDGGRGHGGGRKLGCCGGKNK